MDKKLHINRKLILYIILSISWTSFIFSFSFQTGKESSEVSQGIVATLIDMFFGEGFLFADELEFFIRKLAHFAEYLVLGVLVSLTVRETRCSKLILVPWALGTLVACCDETIQLFSNGRSGQVTDVMLDSVGVLCGCVVVSLVCKKFLEGDKGWKK